MGRAHRETTPTRERISINGLWQWQPAKEKSDQPPTGNWGYFKVPGPWPDNAQRGNQTVYAHPNWKDASLASVTAAWYQREITVPQQWAGRRITVHVEYLNSFSTVYLDGRKLGEMRYPWGDVDITSACRPGSKHVLSVQVAAMPLKAVMLSYNDTASAREVKGSVARRGLCGDIYLIGSPAGPRISDVKVDTSVRNWRITFNTSLNDLDPQAQYTLQARIKDGDRVVQQFTCEPFQGSALSSGRIAVSEPWRPEKLWDTHTPQNQYDVSLFLLDSAGKVLDVSHPVRFGFREFWIEGRDFYLNGTRIFLSSVPVDNAQMGPTLANYQAVKETFKRLETFGINFVYTHNYGCEPGAHLSFEEELRAADDTGMLVSFSQPHFGHYDWNAPDADQSNGYARHAEFYAHVAGNHPSVVCYSTSHNGTGYGEDMNPDMIDGIHAPRQQSGLRSVERALRAEAIIKRLDPNRIVYHHASGDLSAMYTINFYANFVPIQEMCDWFEHWATLGVKPVFTCEYTVPVTWDWTLYRGWYKGKRAFGDARAPWEFCIAEWNSQFFGDKAFQISNEEKANLRWEAQQFREGKTWLRYDYPYDLNSNDILERYPVYALYFADVWPAFRTWGMSANSPWFHGHYWRLREGVDKSRKPLPVDWDNLQRPGLSPDYTGGERDRVDLTYKLSDWVPTVAAQKLMRTNMPLLAYIAGKPAAFTSKDHNFRPGETVEKQIVVINNSRQTVTCDCQWSFRLPTVLTGSRKVTMPTGQQERIALRFALPADAKPGRYELSLTAKFSTGETQEDSFTVDVLPTPTTVQMGGKIAIFDPKGETTKLLGAMGIQCQPVDAAANLSAYDTVIVGKAALRPDGPAPDITRVRNGLKVVLFEQTADVLEKRFGFRVVEYGLRWVFKRVPDHPLLADISEEHLRNWRGEATILPPRLKYDLSPKFNYVPTVKWCDIPVAQLWRCGCRGNLASVLIEKPARGDFLPIIDGGYSLQYSPLMEYREGQGMVLFCQMDVTGRTETDPTAERLARNIVAYASSWKPAANRQTLYVGEPAGKGHLEKAGVSVGSYQGGKLSLDQVLVVGPGSGQQLSTNAAAIAEWLKAGGHLLAIGLDQADISALLPKVTMKKEEHIAACFEPFGTASPPGAAR
jgi:hypothetical protein